MIGRAIKFELGRFRLFIRAVTWKKDRKAVGRKGKPALLTYIFE